MGGVCVLIMLILMAVYVDFAVWYCAEMHNIWHEKKRKYRGVLYRFWDWWVKRVEK